MDKIDIMSDKFQRDIELLDVELRKLKNQNELMKKSLEALWKVYISMTKDDMK